MATEIQAEKRRAIKKPKAITLTETQEILADTETMAALRRGIEESKSGKSIPLSQLKAELDL